VLAAGCHSPPHAPAPSSSSSAVIPPPEAAASASSKHTTANALPRLLLGDASADPSAACTGCDAAQKQTFSKLVQSVLPGPADGGVRVFLAGSHQLWDKCGVHNGDIAVRVAGQPIAGDAISRLVLLAKACATHEPIQTISVEEQRAVLCRRTPARPAAWMKRCEQFFSELRALPEPDGVLLSDIQSGSGPWKCGLRTGSLVTELGKVKKPQPDQLGPLFDACQGAAIHRVVMKPKPPPPPMSPAARRQLLAKIKQGIRRVGPNEFSVDRRIVDPILANQADLLLSARIVPEQRDGKVDGIRIFGVKQGSLLSVLGFDNGDLIESVNGADMTSPEHALQAYAALRGAREVTVHLERGGKPVDLKFHMH
jgi:hypothetical protein